MDKSIEVLRNKLNIAVFFCLVAIISSCATQKKRGEMSWLAKRYHNMTAKYNGYYNADVIMDETYAAIDATHEDNYNRILPVYIYADQDSPENVKLELDRAIEKVTKVSRLHESSKWVDDCYVLMGKAQYLQGNYEAAEETFEYFVENFNPLDPDSRYNATKTSNSKSKAKQRQKEIQAERKERIKERKEKEKQREKELKEKQKERKERSKNRKQAQRDRDKAKKADQQKAKEEREARERENKIKERDAAAENSKKLNESKKLSAEERRKLAVKERNQRVKNRKKEARRKEKEKNKPKTESTPKESEVKQEEKTTDEQVKTDTEKKEEQSKVDTKKESKKEKRQREKEEQEEREEAESKSKKSKNNKVDDLKSRAKGGILKHRPAYYEGMLWLAKTYIMRENYVKAKYYVNRIDEEIDNGVPAHVTNEVPAVRADLYIQQKLYDEAIDPLRQSIESTSDRGLKARYAFILAQIHQKNGNAGEAANAFAQVDKYSNSYDMTLNAKLNQLKNEWASGNLSYDGAIRRLGRMAKDKKNLEYEGPIYFTRAELKQASNDQQGAIEDFEKALSSSVSSINQIESYYRLATLYFGLEDYLNAKSYYDSTATVMPKRDDRYSEVTQNKNNLREIVKNIYIIEEQDSLLALGEMSKEELLEYADNILKQREEKEAESLKIASATPPPARTTGGTSKFFAYNARSVQKGKSSFNQRWGSRQLEDDWRRSNKQSSIIEEEEVETLAELDTDRQKELDKILRGVPQNKKAKAKALEKVEIAYFDLGIGYRNYLKNYAKSAEVLDQYVSKFPKGKNIPDAYYYLYLNSKDLGENTMAQEYYDVLTRLYPKSDYAKVLKNPEFAKELLTEERKISKAYDEAYALFENAEFQSAYDMIKKAKTDFGKDHDMISKYDLLEAMCIGNVEGKDAYVSALRKVTIKYNNTPEQLRAREMLRFLKGDGEAFEGEITTEDIQDFVEEDDKLHYIIVALFEADGNTVNESKNSINKYNSENHKDKRIRSTSIYLNQKTKTHLILLRRFENKKVSMDYLKTISSDSESFLDPGKYSYDLFSVNQKNYREIVKQKTTRTYRLFFDTYYLDGDK